MVALAAAKDVSVGDALAQAEHRVKKLAKELENEARRELLQRGQLLRPMAPLPLRPKQPM